MSKGTDAQPKRPAKGDVVLDSNRRRWKVIAIDVDDEGLFVQNRLAIRFVRWSQWEKHWRKLGHD